MNFVKNTFVLACVTALVACGGGGSESTAPTGNDDNTPDIETPADAVERTEDLVLSKQQAVNSHKSVTFTVQVSDAYVDANVVLCATEAQITALTVQNINFTSCIYNGIIETTDFSVDLLMLNTADIWTAAVLKEGQTPIVKNYSNVTTGQTLSL